MLKGVIVQGLAWESYEAVLWPLVPPLRESKTTGLVICQGKKGHLEGEVLVFPVLPIARHPGLSVLETLCTSPIALALLKSI